MKFIYLFTFVLLGLLALSSLTTTSNVQDDECALVKDCEEKARNATKSCFDFMKFVQRKCDVYNSYCANQTKSLARRCIVGFCQGCFEKAEVAYKDCIKFHEMVFSTTVTNSTGCTTMKKKLRGKCPSVCSTMDQEPDDKDTVHSSNGKSCNDIHNKNPGISSGMYWIKPDGDSTPVQAYCDMSYQGGGWTLASYGYVNGNGLDPANKNIPNMNHPNGYNWNPTNRNGTNGLIALEHGAVNLARGAQFMLMAAGNNPNDGGIDGYSHVYLIDISNNTYNITFANHGPAYGGVGTPTIPRMHIQEFSVTALKGENYGTVKRYALAEALGVAWDDARPVGYGFYTVAANYGSIDGGPFFPSVQSGDGKYPCPGYKQPYPPDVVEGCPAYTYHGWYTMTLRGMYGGETSIWFK